MVFTDIRSTHLPYCVRQVKKGHFVILNREYKPLGHTTTKVVNYDLYQVRIKGLTPRKAVQISARGLPDVEDIHLYDDECIPTHSPKKAAAYFKRLGVLMTLCVESENEWS